MTGCRLPHRIASLEDGTPVFFGYTELGTVNAFVEIWRYRSCGSATQILHKDRRFSTRDSVAVAQLARLHGRPRPWPLTHRTGVEAGRRQHRAARTVLSH